MPSLGYKPFHTPTFLSFWMYSSVHGSCATTCTTPTEKGFYLCNLFLYHTHMLQTQTVTWPKKIAVLWLACPSQKKAFFQQLWMSHWIRNAKWSNFNQLNSLVVGNHRQIEYKLRKKFILMFFFILIPCFAWATLCQVTSHSYSPGLCVNFNYTSVPQSIKFHYRHTVWCSKCRKSSSVWYPIHIRQFWRARKSSLYARFTLIHF